MLQGFSPGARFLLVAAAFIVVIAGLRASTALVGPFLMAIFVAVLAAPPLCFLRERGAPTWVALILVTSMMAGCSLLLIGISAGTINEFLGKMPEYEERLRSLTGDLMAWLEGWGIHLDRDVVNQVLDPARLLGLVGDLLKGLSKTFGNALLILLTVMFILFEASSLPNKLQLALRSPDTSMQRLQSVLDQINHYMVIKTSTSVGTGLVIWLWLTLFGVDFAILWGVVGFLLNFIPTIGSILAAIPAVLLALVQLGIGEALVIAGGYVVINTLIGSILEPRIMGRGLGLSALVVFVSLIFWGWVLGPVGMFLSVPLTMTLKIALDGNPQTRPIAIMLGPDVTSAELAKQRMDTDDASKT